MVRIMYLLIFILLKLFFLGVSATMENYKIIDLTHKINPGIPTWDLTCGYHIKTIFDYKDFPGEFKFRVQVLDIRASAGTHIDSPAHCFEGARDVSDISINELICPCVVINVSEKSNEKYKVSIEDIENFEAKYGTIKSGTFVLINTGWSKFWNDPKKYHNNLTFPSVSAEVAELLLERQISGLGIDTLSPDCDEKGFFVHKILLGADKFIIENVANLEMMPESCSEILIMPLNLQGAVESPIRLVGMVKTSNLKI